MPCETRKTDPQPTAERMVRRWRMIMELYDEDEYVHEVAKGSVELFAAIAERQEQADKAKMADPTWPCRWCPAVPGITNICDGCQDLKRWENGQKEEQQDG